MKNITSLDGLKYALDCLHDAGVTNSYLLRKYGLRGSSLSSIGNGRGLLKMRDKYLWAFVSEINALRLKERETENVEKEMIYTGQLADICLIGMGIPIDVEISKKR